MTLFHDMPPERTRWTGNTLPVLYVGDPTCRCGGMVVRCDPVTSEPLFFHGGYGEAQRVTVTVCLACHRTTERLRESVRPTHYVVLEAP